MAGLVPAIHVFPDMDGVAKPHHDDEGHRYVTGASGQPGVGRVQAALQNPIGLEPETERPVVRNGEDAGRNYVHTDES
jgi:hypothetical protein